MNKQIEEMARFMLEKSNSANVEPIFTAQDGTEIVLGEEATKLLDDVLEQAFIPFLAECLVKEGYRKSTDVAREIFEEIEREIKNHSIYWSYQNRDTLLNNIAELKKKYESDGADDEQIH
ncbi:MAG: hypothetical protein E7590_01040 [Ruminococcaceae bacterium]|nr:hypothetical protein [Oscillospiraceae bacterium]